MDNRRLCLILEESEVTANLGSQYVRPDTRSAPLLNAAIIKKAAVWMTDIFTRVLSHSYNFCAFKGLYDAAVACYILSFLRELRGLQESHVH